MRRILDKLELFNINTPNPLCGGRVASVDALRGFDMFWIIGGEYILRTLDEIFHSPVTQFINAQLHHAEWLGFNFYDLIMPLFLFVVGIAMVYSFSKRLAEDPSRKNIWKHILIRVFWLWILGMAVQGNLLTYDINEIKLYSNTLQAIAAGYLIAAIFILNLSVAAQIMATAGLMLLYWLILALVPVPGVGAGLYTPDGNFALYFDKLVLGKFQDGTTYTWIISSLNFGATTMLGVFAGYLLRSPKRPLARVYNLVIIGVALIVLGKILDIWHPLIKHIWTGSFVLFSGGICWLLLAFFYYVIDVKNYRKWSIPFVIIGSNAIAAYVSSHLFDFRLIGNVLVGGLEKYIGNWFPFVSALGGFIVLYLILRYMYQKKIYLKI